MQMRGMASMMLMVRALTYILTGPSDHVDVMGRHSRICLPHGKPDIDITKEPGANANFVPPRFGFRDSSVQKVGVGATNYGPVSRGSVEGFA